MRIVIAEDSVLLRAGLTRILADAGEDVVATVGDADELLRVVEPARARPAHRRRADAADPHRRRPARRARRSARSCRRIGILVLSQYVEEQYATELLGGEHAGRRLPAEGPHRRRRRVPRCGAARSATAARALDPEVVAQLLARSRQRDPLERLTAREREVLDLMAEGRSQHGDRPPARRERQGGREARRQHLHQARPAADDRRPPPRPRGAAVGEGMTS